MDEPNEKYTDSSESENEKSSSSESESEEQREGIRSELKNMSFAELIKLKEQLGTKVYNEAMFGEKAVKVKPAAKKEFKRDNKNRPREITTKKQVPLFGTAKKKQDDATSRRDPRFDIRCGEYDRKSFKQDYGFITDIRERELGELKTQLKNKELSVEERGKIKLLIQRMNNQIVEEKKNKLRESVAAEEHQIVKKARKEDKTPFHTTTRERKARELVKQYVELKEKGAVNKHLEKRRKKNKSRDMKKMNFA